MVYALCRIGRNSSEICHFLFKLGVFVRELANECVNKSRAHVYDDPAEDDANSISSNPRHLRLTPWDSSIHDRCRNQMLGVLEKPSLRGREPLHPPGCSWFDVDRMTCMVEPLQKSIEMKEVDMANSGTLRVMERLDLSGISTESSPQISDERSVESSSVSLDVSSAREEEEVTDC